jgi:glycosyltransferase involved in cell wall biosynthesis
LVKFLKEEEYDLVFVGFFGQPFMPVIRALAKKPVILDAFVSGYDTMCFDRKRFGPDSSIGKLFFWLDKRACEQADLVICDTYSHIDYFCEQFSLDRGKFARIFVGAEEDIFFPRAAKGGNGAFSVLYYGTYMPLHGIEYIVRAAKLMEKHEEIQFKIIGKGMTKHSVLEEAKKLKVGNINFVNWVPYMDLPGEIAQADLCLGGHFGDSEKAKRVIACKTFQMAAVGRPVVLTDNAANKELFSHRENAYFTRPADADALAGAIMELSEDDSLREKISRNAYLRFKRECNIKKVGQDLQVLLRSAMNG